MIEDTCGISTDMAAFTYQFAVSLCISCTISVYASQLKVSSLGDGITVTIHVAAKEEQHKKVLKNNGLPVQWHVVACGSNCWIVK